MYYDLIQKDMELSLNNNLVRREPYKTPFLQQFSFCQISCF